MEAKESNGIANGTHPVEPGAVREQLERILGSASFRNSKRHSAFLRYVVEEALGGSAPQLKERSIGVQVFGLDPTYDTSSNPVVRVSAGELRKRVAQYYHLPEHTGELRIDLPPGSYAPEFSVPATEAAAAPAMLTAEVEAVRPRSRLRYYAMGLAAVAVGLLLWMKPWTAADPYTRFWEPVWNSSGQAIISVAARTIKDDAGRVLADRMVMNDAVALAHLTPVLQSHGKDFRILNRDATTLADLKQGPAILIGAFSNELAMRLMREARFNFEMDQQAGQPWIRDRQNPSNKQWRLARPANDAVSGFTDYAIVSRVLDPTTDRIAVVAAGITARGTRAAAEFVSSPAAMNAIAKTAAKEWSGRNVQVVLAVPLGPDSAGPVKLLAAYSW